MFVAISVAQYFGALLRHIVAIDVVEPILGAVDAVAGGFQDAGEWQAQLQF